MFYLLKTIRLIILPPSGLLVLFGIGLFLLWKGHKRAGLRLMIISLGLLYFLSTGFGNTVLMLPLEKRYPPLTEAHLKRPYIVVLTGGLHNLNHLGIESSASEASIKRLIYAIEIFRASEEPILVITGGKGSFEGPEVPEAMTLERTAIRLGIPKRRIVLEAGSRDTWENAQNLKVLLREMNRPVVLVTSAFHMTRAMQAFRKNGIKVLPAPTDYRTSPLTIYSLIPSAEVLRTSATAIGEYLALGWYFVKSLFYNESLLTKPE